MARYAAETDVPVDRSRSEIERTLLRFGATTFAYVTEPTGARIAFERGGRRFVLALPLPPVDGVSQRQHEQDVRSSWRALLLVIKAKLVAIDSGVATFEDEFLAYTALPSGATVGQWVGAQLEHVYASQEMPALLPGA